MSLLLVNSRTKMGFSLREVSKASGISPSQILRIESGKFDCTIKTLVKLCGALGISPSEFMEACTGVNWKLYFDAAKSEDYSTTGLTFAICLRPKETAVLQHLVGNSAIVIAGLIRATQPEKFINDSNLLLPEQQDAFEKFSQAWHKTDQYYIQRIDVLTSLQQAPLKFLADCKIISEPIFRKFLELEKSTRRGAHPWFPVPAGKRSKRGDKNPS